MVIKTITGFTKLIYNGLIEEQPLGAVSHIDGLGYYVHINKLHKFVINMDPRQVDQCKSEDLFETKEETERELIKTFAKIILIKR